jgi:GntR family histidine utilization transcriptional repressor
MKARFAQIKAIITEQIENGDIRPGDQVPSENVLADRYQVSRMTARRALTELVDEGILMRTQGLGTFVSDHRPMSSMLKLRSINDEIQDRGHQYSNKVLQQDLISTDEAQSAWLGLPGRPDVFHSKVVHYENALPVQLEERFVNPGLAPEYLTQDFTQITANQYLSEVAPLTEADHIVEAVLASDAEAELLNIDKSQPCLKVCRRTYSAKGIVSYAILLHPGNRYRLGGHFDY